MMRTMQLRLQLQALEDAQLSPYMGSALRGILGTNLRARCCRQPDAECDDCAHRLTCAFTQVFHGIATARGQHDIHNPFIIRPPWGPRTLQAGDRYAFDVALFAAAVDHADLILHAFADIQLVGLGASRKRFRLVRIVQLEPKRLLFDGSVWLQDPIAQEVPLPREIPANGAQLTFETPLRYKRDGAYADRVYLPSLVSSIMRRYALLSGEDVPEATEEYLREAHLATVEDRTSWVAVQRYSNRVNGPMEFGGLMGEVAFAGNLSAYTTWLSIGELIHVGKNCTFGYGGYEAVFW